MPIEDYVEHFSLETDPFSVDFLCPLLSQQAQAQSLEHLLEFESRNVILTAREGYGKTRTLQIFQQKSPRDIYCFTVESGWNLQRLLAAVAEEMLIPLDRDDVDAFLDAANHSVLNCEPDQKPVLLLDQLERLSLTERNQIFAMVESPLWSLPVVLVVRDDESHRFLSPVCQLKPLPLGEATELLNRALEAAGYSGEAFFSDANVVPMWQKADGNLHELHRFAREALIDAARVAEVLSAEPVSKPVSKTFPAAHIITIAALVSVLGVTYLYRDQQPESNVTSMPVLVPDESVKPVVSVPAVVAQASSLSSSPVALSHSSVMPAAQEIASSVVDVAYQAGTTVSSSSTQSGAVSAGRTEAIDLMQEQEQEQELEQASALRPTTSSWSADEEEVLAWPEDGYTLQLLAMTDAKAVERFVRDQGNESLKVVRVSRKNQIWYLVLMGRYTSMTTARTAIESLPAPLRRAKPWPRKLMDIQKEMGL